MRSRKSIAVVGSGISGLSAAWLLAKHYDVTLFEAEGRAGGHSNTCDVPGGARTVPVDTGFIVYNVASYPNLIALFDHLKVPTTEAEMSFAVSLDDGAYEYAGTGLATLFGQPTNFFRPSHWRMICDIFRFFREAVALAASRHDDQRTLGQYLAAEGYSDAFVTRHILPMAAAIWSTPSCGVLDFPISAFVRFFANHGLLQVKDRPQWRTVVGGSREYVRRLLADFNGTVRLGEPVQRVARSPNGVVVSTLNGDRLFDACVIATHADDALALLVDPSPDEATTLGAFRYIKNRAVLHSDVGLMPRIRRIWSSWNYISHGTGIDSALAVTYWMNKLQPLGAGASDLFVSLNPDQALLPEKVIATFDYAHPMFDQSAMRAQRELWRLQGQRQTWYCGSYFGYGFHEDGLQAGLAAAEAIGGVRRPWTINNESCRIHARPHMQSDESRDREAAE
ncbi:MAG: FAD-dependent oxidoreductase [Hyphomicrobiaceae bacterium]|nr:FAD-dependent oxidoreductase [Hyphomicrobiaceae bacterium]